MSDNKEVIIEIETENDEPDSTGTETQDDTVDSADVNNEKEELTLETLEKEIEELKEEYKKQIETVAESEREQYEAERERLLRTAAEAENTKRRVEIDAKKQLKFANKNIIEGIIPVLDSLEAAIKSVDEKVESDEPLSDLSNFSEGVQLVHKQLIDVLRIHGLSPIDAASGPFDPNQHEAVFATESDDVPEGSIIEEYRRGYLLHDQVIRAAQVVVSKGVEIDNATDEVVEEQQIEISTEEEED